MAGSFIDNAFNKNVNKPRVKAEAGKAFVYWIRLPEHTCPRTQGYIGITKNSVEKRLKEHIHNARKNPKYTSYRAFLKYEAELVCEVLFYGNDEGCSHIEEYFRPEPNIGWNIRQGGRTGNTWSDESKKKLSEAKKNIKISEATRIAQKASLVGKVGSKAPNAKVANIYNSTTNELVAENVCIAEWCRETFTEEIKRKAAKLQCTANVASPTKTAYGYKAVYVDKQLNQKRGV